MEARNSFCFPKNIKKTEPFSYRKKVRFLQREAPFARFETVQNPCRNRAETVHLLSDKQNRSIPHRLDGIGLRGHTPKIKSRRGILPHAVISAMR